MTTPTMAMPAPAQRTPSIAFPLVLISLGVAFLLANLGYLTHLRWLEVARLWPVLLVLAGVDILLRPRSFALAAVVEVGIVIAAFAYLVGGIAPASTELTHTVNLPRATTTDLNLTVNYGAGEFTLAGGGTDLVAVRSTNEDVTRSVDQSGSMASVTLSSNPTAFGFDGRDRNWEVRLPSDVRTGMTLNLGAGRFDVDLSAVQISHATINAGASDMTIRLPVPKGDVRMTIAAGASDLKISVPQGVAYKISFTGVIHSIDGPLQSADYATATDRVTITLSAAASSVSIR